jgi:hypothetical protein
MPAVEKIISGGQTGADRAALDVAMKMGIPVGGWCPRGRKAEDGPIADHYPLEETISEKYRVRTERNVKESDGTIIFIQKKAVGGTELNIKRADVLKKPYLIVDLDKPHDFDLVKSWLFTNHIKILNVAGPRASKHPDIYAKTKDFMVALLK